MGFVRSGLGFRDEGFNEHLECLNKLAAIERAIDLAEAEIR